MSVRSSGSHRSSLPPIPPSNASQRSSVLRRGGDVELASQRSGNSVSIQPSLPQSKPSSVRSSTSSKRQQSTSTASVASKSASGRTQSIASSLGTGVSISSSEAMNKLQLLEQMLNKERTAREHAEATLKALEREKRAREEATRRSEAAQKQLAEVLLALQSLVGQPADPGHIRKLQQIIKGTKVPPTAVNPPTSFIDAMGMQDEARAHKGRTGFTVDHKGEVHLANRSNKSSEAGE